MSGVTHGEVMLSRAAIWEHIKRRRKGRATGTGNSKVPCWNSCRVSGVRMETVCLGTGREFRETTSSFATETQTTAVGVQSSLSLSYLGGFMFCIILSRTLYYRWSAFHWLFYFTITKKQTVTIPGFPRIQSDNHFKRQSQVHGFPCK